MVFSVVWCVIFSLCASCTPYHGTRGRGTIEEMTLIEVFVKSFAFDGL